MPIYHPRVCHMCPYTTLGYATCAVYHQVYTSGCPYTTRFIPQGAHITPMGYTWLCPYNTHGIHLVVPIYHRFIPQGCPYTTGLYLRDAHIPPWVCRVCTPPWVCRVCTPPWVYPAYTPVPYPPWYRSTRPSSAGEESPGLRRGGLPWVRPLCAYKSPKSVKDGGRVCAELLRSSW